MTKHRLLFASIHIAGVRPGFRFLTMDNRKQGLTPGVTLSAFVVPAHVDDGGAAGADAERGADVVRARPRVRLGTGVPLTSNGFESDNICVGARARHVRRERALAE
jgi:hypothetical protein